MSSPLKRLAIRLRWRWYCGDGSRGFLRYAPASARRRLKLDDVDGLGSRRIEVGGGPYPEPGFIHVDSDPNAYHLEAVSPAWDLPFADDWATEIRAVHVLEHVPAPRLVETLREWRRVLAPGGRTRIHVPNTPQLFDAYRRTPLPEKWALVGAITGVYADPKRTRSPEALPARADHQVLFDWEILQWALDEAGFEEVEDLTEQTEDRHTANWKQFVSHCSLVATAVKPARAPVMRTALSGPIADR